ncbi:MAG: tetratricopeptide repeat protein [Gallionella sp.]
MSLLLDARKKSQQAQAAQGGDINHSGLELSLEEHPNTSSAKSDPQPAAGSPGDDARSAGKNLFNAKSPAASGSRIGGINRNLILALGGTVILLAAGAGYFWYLSSAGSNQPLRPLVPIAVATAPAPAAVTPQKPPVAETTTPASTDSAHQAQLARDKRKPSRQSTGRIHIKPQQAEPLDSLVGNAYLAYRSGKLDEARQMYLEVLAKDARNTDALLGLAAIAQQSGEDGYATQYYLRVLTLDPRNAVAHAGMSTLSADQNSESRLKYLLREQRDSAALHFALGNIYAGQSRWGEAQTAYFNAYTLDSSNAELAFNLAVSLDHLGQSKSAAQYYQRALQLAPVDGVQPQGFDRTQISQRVKELTR